MVLSKNEIFKAKTKTYQTLLLAMNDADATFIQLAEQLDVHSQSLTQSVRNKTLRLETLYQIEMILKRKIVYSQFDDAVEGKTEVLLAEIKRLEDFVQLLVSKIPNVKEPMTLTPKKRK